MSQNILPQTVAFAKAQPAQAQAAMTSFLNLFSLVGIMVYGVPFFYDFFVKEFGWSRATVTSGNALGKILIGPLFGFLAGWFIDRFGPRRLMLMGIVMGGGALIALGSVSSLPMFYACFMFIALAYVCGGPLPNQVLLSRWFDKARGRAMGFAYIGIGVGGFVTPLLAAWLIQRFGWRNALMMLGALMIVIALPLAWFVKDAPPDWEEQKSSEPPVPIGSALRGLPFYLLAIGSMASIAAVGGTNQNLKLFLSLSEGYSQTDAAKIISLVLAASIAGRLLMGWLADRFPKKYVMLLIYLLVAGSIPLLFFVKTPGVIYLFAVIFGIGVGGDYMIIPLMAAELFGVRVLGRLLGIIVTADGVAEAVAPMIVGWFYDRSRSYANGFMFLIVMAALGAVAVAMLPNKRIGQRGAEEKIP